MLFLILAALLSDLSGPVIGVVDGDTVDILVEKRTVRVRLAEIDAPERKQAFGTKAKQALGAKVFGKNVRVEIHGQDRYKRTLGTLFLGSENINHWLVREGWAWRYDKYSKSAELLRLQGEAKAGKRGLWADTHPVEPWLWRNHAKDDR